MIKCLYCDNFFHIKKICHHIKNSHSSFHEELQCQFQQNVINCICGKEIFSYFSLNSYILNKIYNVGILRKRSFCSKHCSNKKITWNKGLNKHTHDSILKISLDRMGKNNPIHKVLDDKEKKENWRRKILSDKNKEIRRKSLIGKTWEQIHGKEKSDQMKQFHSERLKTQKIHLGFKHSEENKKLFKILATKMHSDGQFKKTSKDEYQFYEKLLLEFPEFCWQSNVNYKYYTLDISIPDIKFGIEVDGDYWHCNEKLGFNPKTKQQHRNIVNDKRKNSYFLNKGWVLLRFWVSDIKINYENIIATIKEELCKLQK